MSKLAWMGAVLCLGGCVLAKDDGNDGIKTDDWDYPNVAPLDFGQALDAPIANCAPTPPTPTGDPYEDCVTRINQLRWECQKYPPLERWPEGEGCADQHAEYDSTATEYHAGFAAVICKPGGMAQNECPGWDSKEMIRADCMQLMWDEGPGEDFHAHGHYLNMTNRSFTHVACGFFTTPGGDVWSVQNFY